MKPSTWDDDWNLRRGLAYNSIKIQIMCNFEGISNIPQKLNKNLQIRPNDSALFFNFLSTVWPHNWKNVNEQKYELLL